MSQRLFSASVCLALLTACSEPTPDFSQSSSSAASVTTQQHNQAVNEQLPFQDQTDFEQAKKGLIAQPEALEIISDEGEVLWRMADYAFLNDQAPTSVNPSLWRQAQLNAIHGLFEVKPGIYQLRGFDTANMTLIEGDSGWIVIDPLTAKESARVAFDFAMQHLPKKPISAMLFTHSHMDHFGGVLGLKDYFANDIPIIAPEGFLEEATSENVIAGPAMTRRATYMYGRQLPLSSTGHVGSGLGKGVVFGTFGVLEPNTLINQTGSELTIDGVPFVFQYTPESEAPAEMTFYLPEHKAFCGAELVSRTMHNLYTLRGTKVRDARKWSAYINEAKELFGDAEIYFGSHHWPIWGQPSIQTFLTQQRDTYKFIHDQTVRHLNSGLVGDEIAEQLQLPESLANNFSNRGYYGTLKHNSRAVYQAYMGWYDGNPAHLNPLPASQSASRYVQLMGGADTLMQHAQSAFDQGDYRWSAELLNHLVFAEPTHQNAKNALARAYEQMGFQAESGPWRDVYLSAAQELRNGKGESSLKINKMKDVLVHSPVSNFFDSLSVRLKAEDVDDTAAIAIHISDKNEQHFIWIENSVLHHRPLRDSDAFDVRLSVSHELFVDMLLGSAGLKETLFSNQLSVDGSLLDLVSFFSLFDKPSAHFNIVTP